MTFSGGYSALALAHFKSPRNVGDLADADGTVTREHPACGDRLTLAVRLADGKIEAARFRASACPGTVAAASVLTEAIGGRSPDEVLATCTEEWLVDHLGGLPPGKAHCARLAIQVLGEAIAAAHASQQRG